MYLQFISRLKTAEKPFPLSILPIIEWRDGEKYFFNINSLSKHTEGCLIDGNCWNPKEQPVEKMNENE